MKKLKELIDFADENNKILKFIQTLKLFFQGISKWIIMIFFQFYRSRKHT
jgi:hypothetical protein